MTRNRNTRPLTDLKASKTSPRTAGIVRGGKKLPGKRNPPTVTLK